MRTSSSVILALTLLAAPRLVAAQRPDTGGAPARRHPEFLVTSDWLAANLHQPGVVVLHVGHSDEQYRAHHVPGALFVPLAAVATTVNGVLNEFPAPDRLLATFAALGVGAATRIVVYGDDAGLMAARLWVALDVLGQSGRASLLDGGLVKWAAEHRDLETGSRTPAPAPVGWTWQADRIVSAEWVRARLRDSSVVLVDARDPGAFAGTPGDSMSGHLPGARSVYWMRGLVSADDPSLRPPRELHEALWAPAGADREAVRTIVVYCRTGMQASHDYFVARYLGYPDVRLYDGSMSEWTQRHLPVEWSR